MFALVKKLAGDKKGVTAIEYGLIAGLVAVGIIVALGTLEGSLTGIFGEISTALDNAI